MQVKPGYKQTKVEVIPSDWETKTLGEIGESLIGLTYKPTDVRSDGILVLRSSNIRDGTLCFDNNVFVDMEVPERIMVRSGDILICVRNGSRDLIGKCTLLDERTKGMTFGTFMAVFRTPIHEFAYYQFQSAVIKQQINEHLGATINQITNKSLNSFLIPLPPRQSEQEAIAEALRDADTMIELLLHRLAKKRHVKQGAMQELLTGRRRLPGFEINPGYKNTDAGVIPEDWEVVPIGRVGEVLGGRQRSPRYTGELCKYLRVANVFDGFIDTEDILEMPFSPTEKDHFALKPGDILLNEGQSIELVGRSAIYRGVPNNCCFQNTLVRFRAGYKVTPEFAQSVFQNYLRMGIFASIALQTTSIAHLGAGRLAALKMPLPSKAEQAAIATILSEMDDEIEALKARLAKARQIKLGMMQELLTGRIRLV